MTTSALPAKRPVLGLPHPGERVPPFAWPTGLLYLGSLALFLLTLSGIFVVGWSAWITVPMYAAVTFLMFTVLHEAMHHAVSASTRLNNAFGVMSAPFVAPYVTFPVFKFIHIEHHRNTNEPKTVDPDMWTSAGPAWQLPIRWATLDVWYGVYYLRRIRERPAPEAVTIVAWFFGVVGVLIWAGIALDTAAVLTVLGGNRIGIGTLAWWFDYLPHHGLKMTQREDKYQATRVRVGGEFWLTPLFVYQNYHLVHHLHPSIPFYRYIRAWRRNEQAYLDRNAAISTWFGRSLTPAEYRTWRRLTDSVESTSGSQRPIFHPLRVAAASRLTDDSRLVTFDVPIDLESDYRYLQGQHITLRAIIGGEEVRRSYSIVESVAANKLTVAVKQLDGGVFSRYVNGVLQPGDVLDVMTPTGRFQAPLEPHSQRRYVAVAAGSGITPVMSIIRTTLESEPGSHFTLIYGNRTTASTMFADDIDAFPADRVTVHRVLSREPAALSGRITPALVRQLVPGPIDTWFLCGPQALVDSVRADLGPDETVLTEVFHTDAGSRVELADIDSAVTVALDGVESTFALQSTGGTILDAALLAGLEPPYSCAGGACGTCRAKVLLGSAAMDQNHVLDDIDLAAGYVLTCQAHPTSKELRVDYDA